MGCPWTKIGDRSKVAPENKFTDHPASDLKNNVIEQPHTVPSDKTLERSASYIVDHSENNNTQTVTDDVIEQPTLIPLNNLKHVSSDGSINSEKVTGVDDVKTVPTFVPTNNPMQMFEPTSIQATTDENQSRRINSGSSDKHSTPVNSQPGENNHHDARLNNDSDSVHDRANAEEDIDSISITSNDQIKKQTDDSIQHSTTLEDSLPKRIDSGTSTKRSIFSDNNSDQDDILEDDTISITNASVVDATINALPAAANDHVDIVDADPDAFSTVFVKQRQDVLENRSYRSVIESWNPNSLQQLNESIQTLSKGKSLIDCHWIIFYWIACNIEYDVANYLNNSIPDQSVEAIFRTKKGVCAGYSRLYKYLCDQLGIKCEEVNGYAKGYGFHTREEGAPLKEDHAWNAVEIEQHWYLLDATWGTGHLNKQEVFERKLNCFYFLLRPCQMIYDHLPTEDKWQLLQTPIKMAQYAQMPKIHPAYFDHNLQIISPLHQAHVSLVSDKPYALVLIRTPTDVELLINLKLHEQKVEGGHRIKFDTKQQCYRCYFAPASIGKHVIKIFARKVNSDAKSFGSVVDFTLNVNELPQNPISFPTRQKEFDNLGLKIISPVNTHLIKVCNGATYACVLIQAPGDVDLMGSLENSAGNEIEGGYQVYFDQRKRLWKCKFAPDRDGLFQANIFGKKKLDTDHYSQVISFKIEATQIPLPPLSYPYTWQVFHDLNLKVEAPQNRSTITWPEKASYIEILMRAPDDVQLTCKIKYNDSNVKDESLAQFDKEKKLWQLLFAPQCIGEHELVVFAKRVDEENSSCAVKFRLNVTQLEQAMKFPTVYGKFSTIRGRIYEPLNGKLKKGATVPIHCVIPGANEVNLTVDSKFVKAEGYQDPILQRKITVGSNDVIIYGKYGEKSSYDALVKYTVE